MSSPSNVEMVTVPKKRQIIRKPLVVPQNTSQNNNKREKINKIVNGSINSLKVNIPNQFFNDIDIKIETIEKSIKEIVINSYFNNLKYNNDEEIKKVFKTFIDEIDSIETSANKLNNIDEKIDEYISNIDTNLNELKSRNNSLRGLGSKNNNATIRNAAQKLKIIVEHNKRLKIKLREYKEEIKNLKDNVSKLDDLRDDFKKELYTKIIEHYDALISKNYELKLTNIKNLIKLKKNVQSGEGYLAKIKEKTKMNLNKNKNYNISNNYKKIIQEKITPIETTLNKLKEKLNGAITALKNELTINVGKLKESIKNKINVLIEQIKQCIKAIKSNTSLELIKNELKALQTKYINLNTNFSSIFNKNSTKDNEAKLNELLKVLDNKVAKAFPVSANSGNNRGPNTINFLGKTYKKVTNINSLKKENILLWKTQNKKPIKGKIKIIKKDNKEVIIEKPTIYNGEIEKQQQHNYPFKYNSFNRRNARVELK